MQGLKRCKINNCPALQDGLCTDGVPCVDKDCVWKEIIVLPWKRYIYVQNKLKFCLGYNDKQKILRYEELEWVLDEIKNKLEVEVLDGNSIMDEESNK